MNEDKSLKNMKILIVDYNQINLLLMNSMLSKLNAHVVDCQTGFSAIDLLNKSDFDLIFLDIQMPDLNGFDVLYELKNQDDFQIPVVALSAGISMSELKLYKSLGFAEVLLKPIEEHDLINVIDDVLTNFISIAVLHKNMIDTVHFRILEMVNQDQEKMVDMKAALNEELHFAINTLEKDILNKDWVNAKKILHREKGIIGSS